MYVLTIIEFCSATKWISLCARSVVSPGLGGPSKFGPFQAGRAPFNIRMAKTTKWLNAILHYMKKVKSSISMVFGLFSLKLS